MPTGRDDAHDPWRSAPVGELGEQLLPRWFVLLAVIAVPAALVVFVFALLATGPDDVPVERRRLPDPGPRTTLVGEMIVGEAEPIALDSPCRRLEGLRIAGAAEELRALTEALSALCAPPLDPDVAARLRGFAQRSGVVRFAVFERTGVDSTAVAAGPDGTPQVYLNAAYSRTDHRWVGPLVAYEVTLLAGDPGRARTVVEARRSEAAVCTTLQGERSPSPGCRDAAELLALPDPEAALRDAGHR